MAEADVPQPNTPYIEPGHYKEAVILCSGGYDHSIRYWNAEKGFCERIVQQPDNSHINSLAITPNREILASAGFQHIRLYDIESGYLTTRITVYRNVCTVGFNHLGNWLYTGGEDGYVRIWDVRNRALHCQRQRQFQTPVNVAFLHPNGVEIYVADQSGSIYIWNLQTETLQRLFVTSDGYIQHLSYDKDSRLLAAVDTRGNCYVFRNTPKFFPANMDEKSGEMTKSGFLQRRLMFQAHSKYILKCAFSPDSTLLATASGDQTVKLWSTSDFSVANPTSVVQFDDPFETVTGGGAETGPASMASSGSGSTTTTFKNAYSIDSEMSETMDASMLSNPSAAFLQAPYLVGLFSANQIQQPRPPPCYLRPKKLCEKCQLAGRAGQIAALDPRVPPTSGSSTSAPDPAAIAGGRSLFHSHGCKQAYPTGHSSLAGVIPMQPTLNSLNQLTWNFYGAKSPGSGGAGKKMSDPGLCNHYSHFRSPVHRASVAGMLPEEGGYAKSNLTSPGKNAATSTATTAPSLPSAPSNAYFGATARRLPAYAMRFFDNKYYELHSGVLNTDSEEEEGEAELPLEVRTRRRAEREERKKARKSAEQQEAEEDEEFYRLMKAMRLIEESDDSEDEDEDDDEEDEEEDSDEDEEDEEEETGLRMRSDFIGRKGRAEARKAATAAAKAKKNGQKAAKNGLICCTQCGTCYCSEKANIEAQQAEAAAAAAGSATSGTRSRRPSGNPNATGSQPTGGKNEWAYTNAITPKVTLSTPNQRWVWDVAFTYDSQFIFTASSDQYVRLWSVFTGELTREYSGHQKSVTALGFSDMLKDQPIVG